MHARLSDTCNSNKNIKKWITLRPRFKVCLSNKIVVFGKSWILQNISFQLFSAYIKYYTLQNTDKLCYKQSTYLQSK